jgi:hypothetical protein
VLDIKLWQPSPKETPISIGSDYGRPSDRVWRQIRDGPYILLSTLESATLPTGLLRLFGLHNEKLREIRLLLCTYMFG